jgi:TetR/AcrR family transcriptional regulator, fatty acid metabolism regulator protein
VSSGGQKGRNYTTPHVTALLVQPDTTPEQERLIRSAYRLIGTKGMHRMTLQNVADEAEVSKALVLYHFKTKENLVLATMRWVLAQVAARIAAEIAAAEAPEDKVRAAIDAIFVDALRNRNFYLAYTDLIAHGARNDRFSELNTTFRSIVNGAYADVIRSGMAGPFRVGDLDEAAMTFRALIDGFFLQWLEEDDWERLHAPYKAACTRAVLTYLGASP